MDKILKIAIDEVYEYYQTDHSFRTSIYVHPMFRNGTFTKDNSFQPEEPEPLLTREEFESKLIKEPWHTAVQVMFNHLMKVDKI